MGKILSFAKRCWIRACFGVHRSLHELVMLVVTVLIDHGIVWTCAAAVIAVGLVSVVAILLEGSDIT